MNTKRRAYRPRRGILTAAQITLLKLAGYTGPDQLSAEELAALAALLRKGARR